MIEGTKSSVDGRCPICIRECRRGESFCGRRDADGRLRQPDIVAAWMIDRLFEKPIIHLGPDLPVLSIGSWGCNFRCLGCQNARLSWTATGEGIKIINLDPGVIIRTARARGCRGICYTYNEPAIQIEFVEETARQARAAGLINVFVTNSTLTCSSIDRLAPWIDAVAADIKSFDDNFYLRYCGTQGIIDVAAKIRRCIRRFKDDGCHVEVRTNIIPGVNDSEDAFRRISGWIRESLSPETPWHLTRYFPSHLLGTCKTPAKTLFQAQTIGRDEGLAFVHVHLSKGCDCAGDRCLIREAANGDPSLPSCCDQGLNFRTWSGIADFEKHD